MVVRSFNVFRSTSHQDCIRWLREEQEEKLRRCLAENGGRATRLAIRYVTGFHFHNSESAVDFMDHMAMRFRTNQVSPRTMGVAMRRMKTKKGNWK